jgi:hypothetical protein
MNAAQGASLPSQIAGTSPDILGTVVVIVSGVTTPLNAAKTDSMTRATMGMSQVVKLINQNLFWW